MSSDAARVVGGDCCDAPNRSDAVPFNEIRREGASTSFSSSLSTLDVFVVPPDGGCWMICEIQLNANAAVDRGEKSSSGFDGFDCS